MKRLLDVLKVVVYISFSAFCSTTSLMMYYLVYYLMFVDAQEKLIEINLPMRIVIFVIMTVLFVLNTVAFYRYERR